MYSHYSATITTTHFQNFFLLPKLKLCPCWALVTNPSPPSWHPFLYFLSAWGCLLGRPHRSGNKVYLFFCAWLLSLDSVFKVRSCCSMCQYFSFLMLNNTPLCTPPHILFIYLFTHTIFIAHCVFLSIGRHLVVPTFWVLWIMLLCKRLCPAFGPSGAHTEEELLDYMVVLFLIF